MEDLTLESALEKADAEARRLNTVAEAVALDDPDDEDDDPDEDERLP